jgi:hypothetical protein
MAADPPPDNASRRRKAPSPCAMPAIIELYIRRLTDDSTTAELRVYQRGMTVLAPAQPVTITSTTLLALSGLHTAYGVALAEMVFPGLLKEAWARARGHAEGAGGGVHLRVLIDDPTGALHALRWELLRDPATSVPLAQQEGGSLARTVVSDTLHNPDPPPKPKLRALVAVAGPSDHLRYGLAYVDVAGEAARARQALGDIQATLLADTEPGALGLATLDNILGWPARRGAAALPDLPRQADPARHDTLPGRQRREGRADQRRRPGV